MRKPPKPGPPIPTDHNIVYWAAATLAAATVVMLCMHYLQFYDPLGKLPGVEHN